MLCVLYCITSPLLVMLSVNTWMPVDERYSFLQVIQKNNLESDTLRFHEYLFPPPNCYHGGNSY